MLLNIFFYSLSISCDIVRKLQENYIKENFTASVTEKFNTRIPVSGKTWGYCVPL